MPLSARSILFSALGLTVLAGGTAAAQQPSHLATIALVEKPWAVALDITGYRVHIDGIKPDGRRYFFATNTSTSMTLSVTLEAVSGPATEEGCLTHLERIARTSSAHISQGAARHEVRHIPVVEYLIPETRGPNTYRLHLFACAGKDNVYTDIHVSRNAFTTGDESLLRKVLNSFDIVEAAPASSLDHFRAGSAPYLQEKYAEAIPHYERALGLERANHTLDKSLWCLLVENLGVAYAMTGDLSRSKTIFDYGLSQDPGNPLFHYNLARTFARMNNRDKAMQSLYAAFRSNRRPNVGERIPDPRQDVSFKRFMLDPMFRTLAESLMQPAA